MDRFWSKVDQSGDCWEWRASKRRGYGQFRYDGHYQLAHRVAWQLENGPIPTDDSYHGMCVLHSCDNRSCVNPEHLFLGSANDNMQDKVSKGRQYTKLTKEDIPRIKDMLSCGARQVDIADWFGVSHRTISRISTGEAWNI